MIDTDRLVQAALETGAGPLAVEEGTGLAEFWIEKGVGATDRIVAVECGFVLWLDDHTVIVGVQDRLEERDGILGDEWKTTKETTKFWNEGKWLDSIREGSQIAIYALALRSGTYYPKIGMPVTPAVAQPRIRVQAISKSTPPQIWPTREDDNIIVFSEARLEATRQALLIKADSIRAMRKREGPWQLPGIWCTNQFRRLCEYHEDCVNQRPHVIGGSMQESDPAWQLAVPHLGDRVNDPELVILSASAYAKACECPEAYRRSLGGGGEESSQMQTGTVFHTVIAEFYRQLQAEQTARMTPGDENGWTNGDGWTTPLTE